MAYIPKEALEVMSYNIRAMLEKVERKWKETGRFQTNREELFKKEKDKGDDE